MRFIGSLRAEQEPPDWTPAPVQVRRLASTQDSVSDRIAAFAQANQSAACAPHAIYTESISKMIQIRDVPDAVHSILKARAAREGMSLSDYLKRELERTANQPNLREWIERVRQMKPISSAKSSAEIVRELRDRR